MLADLQGQIERITYANDENGYTVAKLKVYGQRDLVTIVKPRSRPLFMASKNIWAPALSKASALSWQSGSLRISAKKPLT